MNQTMSDDIPQDQVEAVARAICQSRTCEGFNCCQWPAQRGRRQCPVRDGGYEDAALAAIRVLTPMIAAVERLKLNAWMIRNSVATGHGDTIEDLLLELDRHIDMMDADFAHAAAVERERCDITADRHYANGMRAATTAIWPCTANASDELIAALKRVDAESERRSEAAMKARGVVRGAVEEKQG